MGGAPQGNTNNSKGKAWSDALRRALTGERNAEKLAKLADKLIEEAMDGNMTAMKEIGDRLEGKPAQGIEGPGTDGEFVVKIVNYSNTK